MAKKPKRGRPKLPAGEARRFTIRFRVTGDELHYIVGKAYVAGTSTSDFARDVILKGKA